MAEIEIGIGKSGRRAYGFDDIAIVPSRRTRDPEDIDITWQIDAYEFSLPLLGAAMDGVISPRTAIELGRLGGLGVLNLEGLWTKYADPEPLLEEIAELDPPSPPPGCRRSTSSRSTPTSSASASPSSRRPGSPPPPPSPRRRSRRWHKIALDAGLDILVIQGTVVSAEHVSTR
jgi:IMP dehydrogenase